MTTEHTSSNFRWVMLAGCVLTAILVHAMPTMALTVLFEEIRTDFALSNFQIGIIWGLSSFTSMLLALFGGIFADYFGTRRVLVIGAVFVGIFGATRAFATGFYSYLGYSFLLGLFLPMIGVTLHTIASQWFPKNLLGLANGLIASGFATGFMLGSYFSASIFSPLLGGWQNVFIMYGVLAVMTSVAWLIVHPKPTTPAKPLSMDVFVAIKTQLMAVIKEPWLRRLGLGTAGVWACLRGFSGYLPLYLRDSGWSGSDADAALSLFFLASLIGVIPLSSLSDRLGKRKPFIILAGLTLGTSVMLVTIPHVWVIYLAVISGGLLFDVFMAISITTATEVKGIGPAIAGTAVGFMFLNNDLGGVIAPPLGNLLSEYSPEAPFYFWGALAIIGAGIIWSIPNEEIITEK